MKENVKDLQFSNQCSYALLESFNSNDKSFDPYHISIILKSLITLREQFATNAANNNTTNLLAKQEKRSIHKLLTPQGGGIIFALVSSYFAYQAGSFIPSICLLVAFLGLFDDKFKLPILVRYLVQFFVLILFFSIFLISISATLNRSSC